MGLAAGDPPPDFAQYIAALIKQLYEVQQAPETDPNLIRAYGAKLQEAIQDGYDAKLVDFAWDTPDYGMLAHLQNNSWQFSAAKTSDELKALNDALIGPDGKINSFNEFRRQAEEITGRYLNWLKTEYQTAINGARMASKWQKIQRQKDIFPLLKFDAVIDERTSEICRPLNDIVKPVDDPFWDMYYPPNHFNCRSTVEQLRDGEATPDDEVQHPEKVPDMFKFNVGKKAIVFPPESSYYQGLPKHLFNNATLYMPEDEQYLIKYQAEDGTELQVNRKTDIEQASDYKDLLTVGKVLANLGIEVDILPVIHASEEDLRAELLPGVKDGKNPDLRVDGEYAEVKAPVSATYGSIQKNIADAAKQADRVIILLDYLDKAALARIAAERFRAIDTLESIVFVSRDGEYEEFKKSTGANQ